MRRITLWLLVAMACISAVAQQHRNVYHDPVLGFNYFYPSDFKLTPQVAKAMMDDTHARLPTEAQDTADCVVSPFAAEHTESIGGNELLLITRVDVRCVQPSPTFVVDQKYLDDIAVSSLREGLSKFPLPTLADPVPIKLGPHSGSFVQGSGSNGPAMSGYSGVVCAAYNSYVICWAAFTPVKNRLQMLLGSEVQFKNEPRVPLVPTELQSR